MKSISKYIWVVWIVLIIELLTISFFRNPTSDCDTNAYVVVSIHFIVTIITLIISDSKYSSIFVWALILRTLFMLWDLNARHIFTFPGSGMDSEYFYRIAVSVSEDLTQLKEPIRSGFYPKILGVLFYFTGPARILGHYVNVLFGLMVVIFVYKTLVLLNIEHNITKTILLITSFFPNSLIVSAILLREILPTFFVVVSLYYFAKWYKEEKLWAFIISLFSLALGAMFHSGVIGLALGYLIMLLFYKHSSKKFVFSFQNFLLFIPVLIFVFLFSTSFGDVMFDKFRTLEEPSDIFESTMLPLGESAYLQGFTVNNPLQFILFAPIRAFYFLFSPLPFDWRGVKDIVTFFLDALLYMFILYYFFKNKRYFSQNKKLIIILFVSIVIVAIIFGIGVGNAGTALRHRQKIVPVFLVMLGLMMQEKEKTNLLIR
ncbi:MAG TPA: phospholipid carrier-dependent glycosyltransferase [Salinivirgaceae bacterium]|nr:phospholipid carrier-dependent glycosyltransferase [Salinivirgaceae bacterium]